MFYKPLLYLLQVLIVLFTLYRVVQCQCIRIHDIQDCFTLIKSKLPRLLLGMLQQAL